MIYLKWFLGAILGLLLTVANLVLAPIVVLFADERGWLPYWLSWFQTPDNSLDGDVGWAKEHWRWRWSLPFPFSIYVGRVGWLWRNSMYGFEINVLGANTLPSDLLLVYGDRKTGNRPIHNGLCRRELIRDGKVVFWQWYYVKRWSKTRCLRINLGWKLWSYSRTEPAKCQLVISANPFMGLRE